MKPWLRAFMAVSATLGTGVLGYGEPVNGAASCDQTIESGWLKGVHGCLRFRAYRSDKVTERPILAVSIHGDSPWRNPGYQYVFAETLAEEAGNVIAVGLLRPGYVDSYGEKSAGVRGLTTGDNYTEDVIAAIAMAIRQLKRHFKAEKTLLAGHSGGAAIAANVVGLHPGLVDRALLVSCPCVLDDWRAHMNRLRPSPAWTAPVKSVSPHLSAAAIDLGVKATLMVGRDDEVTPFRLSRAYYDVLEKRGIDVELIALDGKPHDIFLEEPVIQKAKAMLAAMQ